MIPPARGPSEVLKALMTVVQMTAAVGVLVALFAALAVIGLWKCCRASGAGVSGGRRTPEGRNAFFNGHSWCRALYLFTLGSLASGTSSLFSSGPPVVARQIPSGVSEGSIDPGASFLPCREPIHPRIAA